MRLKIHDDSVLVWLSANDTYDWAHRPGKAWPCSSLSGHRLFVGYDANGLTDIAVDGQDSADVDATELNAMIADHLADRLPADHPVHFIAVGQFA